MYYMRRLTLLLLFFVGLALFLALSSLPTSAQEGEEPAYVGANMCFRCHRDMGAHFESNHVLTLRQPDDENPALADFAQGEELRTVQFPGEDEARPFTAADVAFVLGTGRSVQRYLYQVSEGQYMVFPAEWSTVDNAWHPYQPADEWPAEAYDFNQQCAGCHTTGLSADQTTWVDVGVQCEACHGPGSAHVQERGEGPIVLSPDPQICGQCHGQGTAPDSHPYPIGYLPGETLVDDSVFTLYPPEDTAHWWPTGHANQIAMQYNESLYLGHSGTLTALKASESAADDCLSCHSEDYRWTEQRISATTEGDVPVSLTVETAQFGVTCTTCHEIHPVAAETEPAEESTLETADPAYALCVSCHQGYDIAGGVHHPVQEMFEGASLVAGVDGIPSAHFAAPNGPDCATCHMPTVPVADGTRISHSFQVIMPGLAMDIQYTCSACHRMQAAPSNLQRLIDDIQTNTQARLEAARAALNNDSPAWVITALDFVEGDGSLGVHNYTYADRLLDAVEAELESQ